MDELVTKISAATGLAPEKAEQALGIMLNLVRTQGNQNKVAELFARLPGAEALVARHGGDGASTGGLLGMLAGGMMGGPLAAVTKLSAAGLSMEQIKAVGTITMDYAKAKAGNDLVRQVAGSIPGLSGYA
ncbi:MAG: DUF2267 domain-containing protein [Hyphomicrobiales bacterium]